MNKVHILIEQKSEDYHGTYKEIIAVFKNKEDAIKRMEQLREENYNCNIEYDYDTWNVI